METVAGDIERAVGPAVLEADCLAVRQTAVFSFELAVDQPMRGPEFLPVARLLHDRHFDLGTVAEVVVSWGVAESSPVEVLLAPFGDGKKADLQGAQFTIAQSAWIRLLPQR